MAGRSNPIAPVPPFVEGPTHPVRYHSNQHQAGRGAEVCLRLGAGAFAAIEVSRLEPVRRRIDSGDRLAAGPCAKEGLSRLLRR